jgi:TatD DNase family protein
MLLDTHCHLTHERYREDLPEVLSRAVAERVSGIVAIASDLDDAQRLLSLLDEEPPEGELAVPRIWGTAGVHPHAAREAAPDLRARLNEALDAHPRVVAVGECGLDFHYDFSPRDIQHRVFELHLDVALERGLPVVVHCREAEVDMAAYIAEAGRAGVRGVLHCFPGDRKLLDRVLESGWMVSFTGMITFRSFEGAEAVRTVPGDRYMLETDGPYMAPVPHRGRRNEPAFLPRILERVAEIRGEDRVVVEQETTANAVRFFGLD